MCLLLFFMRDDSSRIFGYLKRKSLERAKGSSGMF